jgi:hypothetical protein
MLHALAPKLPVQLHCEPYNIRDTSEPGCQPVFRNTVAMLSKIPELAELMNPCMPTGEARRARLKFRLATSGKFIHRNRFRRKQILCCLSGEQQWLFMSSAGGGADALLNCSTNDNWVRPLACVRACGSVRILCRACMGWLCWFLRCPGWCCRGGPAPPVVTADSACFFTCCCYGL